VSPIGMDDRQLSVVEKETLGECFASAEARFEYEKARRLRLAVVLAGSFIVLLAVGVFMYWLGGGGRFRPAPVDEPAKEPGAISGLPGVKAVGSLGAKVQVLAIVPEGSNCHNNVIKFLTETASKRPDQIRANFTTMREFGEKNLESEVGSVCAAVLINGASTFNVTYQGKPVTISLVGTEPLHYNVADVAEALTSVFVKEYGDPGEPICQVPPGTTCRSVSLRPLGAPATAAVTGPSADHGQDHTPPAGAKDNEPMMLPGFREIKPAP
jgi:hypothetical protein